MRERRHFRALVVFVALLFLFLLAEAYLVSAQLQQFLTEDLRKETVSDLELMADSAYEAILKSDYVTIRTFINRWSEAHDEIVDLRAIAPNGFVIEEVGTLAGQYAAAAGKPGGHGDTAIATQP